MRRILVASVTLLCVTAAPVLAQSTEQSASDRAIGALSRFAVAYGGYVVEIRCELLDADKRAALKQVVEADLARLKSVFEPDMVDAATGAGEETAAGADFKTCGADSKEFALFGYDMAEEAKALLDTLPEGFSVTVTR